MSETNCMTCMIGDFKYSLCDNRLCKKYARDGSSEDFARLLLDKDLMVVVRCKDCIHYHKIEKRVRPTACDLFNFDVDEDDFCSRGLKK